MQTDFPIKALFGIAKSKQFNILKFQDISTLIPRWVKE